MGNKTAKIGIKEIAKQTGVSTTAVSLVLNNRPGVSSKTRSRIQKAISDLGYKPNKTARSIVQKRKRNRRSGEIGFLAFGISVLRSDSYYGPILFGVSSRSQDHGLQVQASSFEGETVDLESVGLQRTEGLIITGRPNLKFIDQLRQASIPYVLISCSRSLVPGDSVRTENTESSYRATSHLAELGHQRIAFLGGEKSNPECWERYTGYLRALDEFSLPNDDKLSVFKSFSPDRNEEAITELLSRKVDFTAVCASNDYIAIGVYHVAHQHGLEIPGDLSVVGFDDIETARYLRPRLTTIQTDQKRLGEEAVDRLVTLLDGDHQPLHVRVPTKLIIRKSCAAPPDGS